MPKVQIKKIFARKILDSRANWTIELELETKDGTFISSVPAGASKGKFEAKAIDANKAILNINNFLKQKLEKKSFNSQDEIDNFLIKLDGTKDKSKLGANSILAISMAFSRAQAKAEKLPLFAHIAKIFGKELPQNYILPKPCFNIINGGVHAGNNLDIQEFMIIPNTEDFSENLDIGVQIYHKLKEELIEKFGKEAKNIGDEGGFAPKISKAEIALSILENTIKKLNYEKKVNIGLDCAATQFFKNKKYFFEKKERNVKEMINFYLSLLKKYPIVLLEDPFAENDFSAWRNCYLTFNSLYKNLTIVADDLTVTNPERVKLAAQKELCNGIIIKLNQIGTLTEAFEAVKLAKSFGWKIIVSHRSGETNDDFIADFAVGIGANYIKTGAPARGERIAKYNRLLKIEKETAGDSPRKSERKKPHK